MRGLLLMLVLFSGAAAALEMGCDPDGECSDPCAYFDGGIQFSSGGPEGIDALLKFGGKVIGLKRVSRTPIRRLQKDVDDLDGDITLEVFKAPGLDVRLSSTVLSQSCYEQNEAGQFVSSEKCCGGSTELVLEIKPANGGWTLHKTEWPWGC